MRRTKDTVINGKKIINLPSKKLTPLQIQLNEEERNAQIKLRTESSIEMNN